MQGYPPRVPTRAFIAGGAGFIGSHIVRELLLRDDYEVVVYDNMASGDLCVIGSRAGSVDETG